MNYISGIVQCWRLRDNYILQTGCGCQFNEPQLLWQPPEENICEMILEMLCIWHVFCCILLEIKLLLLHKAWRLLPCICCCWVLWLSTKGRMCSYWPGAHFCPRPVLAFQVLSLPVSVCVGVCLSVCLSVCQSRACPRDNLGPVQTRITKFGSKMQNNLGEVLIVL